MLNRMMLEILVWKSLSNYFLSNSTRILISTSQPSPSTSSK